MWQKVQKEEGAKRKKCTWRRGCVGRRWGRGERIKEGEEAGQLRALAGGWVLL